MKTCRIDECDRQVRSLELCGRHYSRLHKYGDPLAGATGHADKPRRYRAVKASGHPLASKSGLMLVHRKILFDEIGWGPHPCHWCGVHVDWRVGRDAIKSLVVDHLDHDKLNNALSNLVPSCNYCNGHRHEGDQWTQWTEGDPVGVRQLSSFCRRGHPLDEESVYIRPDTKQRRCGVCIKQRSKKDWERKKAANLAEGAGIPTVRYTYEEAV